MPLSNGLFRLAFHTPEGDDYGVAYLQDGRLRGGDSGLAYVGTYEQDDDAISIDLQMTQHRSVPGMVSVLGYNNIVVQMEGVAKDGVVDLHGSSLQAPWVRFSARLTMIAD